MKGLLVINKPRGVTSHDVVDSVRAIIDEQRIGHAGTLDPLAAGVLVVLVGRDMTRRQSEFMAGEKVYEAEIHLGATSDTDDAEGVIHGMSTVEPVRPGRNHIRQVLTEFVGETKQVPPAHSAVKISGRRAYAMARAGVKPDMKPRIVTIRTIELLKYAWPVLTVRVTCGKGTYIRALARDIGEQLGCGGYLSGLTRTRSGVFTLEDALPLASLTETSLRENLVKSTDLP